MASDIQVQPIEILEKMGTCWRVIAITVLALPNAQKE